jgi:hypothetical protein
MSGPTPQLPSAPEGTVADRLVQLEQRTDDLVRWTKILALLATVMLLAVAFLVI